MNADDPLLSVVERFRGRDEQRALAAFVELRATLSARLVEIATYLLGSGPDARDLVEELFGDLWSRRTEFAIETNPRSYFERATERRALNMLRTEARRRRREGEWADDTVSRTSGQRRVAGGDVAIDGDVEARLEAAEIRAALLNAMRALPERQRQVFQRRCTGMPYADIAQALGMREQTARNHFGRVMQSLGQRFPWLRSAPVNDRTQHISDTTVRRHA
ncbi:MAG TPA: sigma-70 family RNA polymerase sigma factor [Gemmatimonadaceae bacterium]|nr:sigma-70 family RNA polymerase sigma factor [Gemmatimonadaceae bacterium]